MTKYLLRRFVSYAILTALATVFAYIAASSFFRPRNRYEGIQPPISESSIDAILSDYGVNDKDPVLLRTWEWLERIVTAPIPEKLGPMSRAGVSLRLLIIGAVLAAVLGVAAGVWGAVRQYKASDQVISYASYILISTPTFVGGVLLMILATKLNSALGFQLIPFTGASSEERR